MFDFNKVQTYESDLPLFHKLGLQPFDIEAHKKQYVGEVKQDDSYVKIWVEGAPAQFFEFEILAADSERKYRVSTGSGALADFWPSVEKMMNDMLVVKAMEQV